MSTKNIESVIVDWFTSVCEFMETINRDDTSDIDFEAVARCAMKCQAAIREMSEATTSIGDMSVHSRTLAEAAVFNYVLSENRRTSFRASGVSEAPKHTEENRVRFRDLWEIGRSLGGGYTQSAKGGATTPIEGGAA